MVYDSETMDYAKDSLNRIKDLHIRLIPNVDSNRSRDEYSRDYARILYSSSFRRLQGKMQMLAVDQNHFFRNRLTHSNEVAQIARGIATDMKLGNTFVVEACSLAHDLGNPPFGHYGEEVLSELVKDIGGFEGNAQTLRILRTLEKKHYEYRGLNLTLRTLLGVIKYFRKFDKGKNKKFIYDDDYAVIKQELYNRGLADHTKTIDMQIMDLSDEIAYAAHDLEDCLSLNLFTIDDLLYEFKIHKNYSVSYTQLEDIVNQCKDFAAKGRHFSSSEEYSFLFRKELTSKIVNTLINDIAYSSISGRLELKNHETLSKGLKKLVFQLVLRKPFVQIYEKKGELVLRGLYTVYSDEQFNKDLRLLPPEYRLFKTEDERRRNIIDFISGMMDHFSTLEYEKYYGKGSLDKLYNGES